jgi:hypothetical protein
VATVTVLVITDRRHQGDGAWGFLPEGTVVTGGADGRFVVVTSGAAVVDVIERLCRRGWWVEEVDSLDTAGSLATELTPSPVAPPDEWPSGFWPADGDET